MYRNCGTIINNNNNNERRMGTCAKEGLGRGTRWHLLLIHTSYILARIYPNMNFETLCRVTRIFIFRVETEGFYATLVIIPGNITIEIAAECSEGERRRFCQRQTLCVYVCIWISRTIRGAPVSVSRFETIFFPPRQKKEVEAASKLWLTERASFPRKHNIEDPKILWKQSTNTRASPSLVESFVHG